MGSDLIQAGNIVGERLWRLPLDASQDYLVESDIADVRNTEAAGPFGKGAGSPTAGAKFSGEICGRREVAHIDLAGTVWSTRRTAQSRVGATGYGVRLLERWLAMIENSVCQWRLG